MLFRSVNRQLSVRRDPLFEDAVSALVNLGYKKGMAEDAVKQARVKEGEKADIEGLIKKSLMILSKS